MTRTQDNITTADVSKIDLAQWAPLLAFGPYVLWVYTWYTIVYSMIKPLYDKNKILGIPVALLVLPVFLLSNILNNWVVMTLILREFPREFLTTTRCKRWRDLEGVPESKLEMVDLIGGMLDRYDMGHYR